MDIPDALDAQILWHNTPFIQNEQIRLDDKFRMYYATALMSKKLFQVDA